jgi:hypothetical protein
MASCGELALERATDRLKDKTAGLTGKPFQRYQVGRMETPDVKKTESHVAYATSDLL